MRLTTLAGAVEVPDGYRVVLSRGAAGARTHVALGRFATVTPCGVIVGRPRRQGEAAGVTCERCTRALVRWHGSKRARRRTRKLSQERRAAAEAGRALRLVIAAEEAVHGLEARPGALPRTFLPLDRAERALGAAAAAVEEVARLAERGEVRPAEEVPTVKRAR